MQKRSGRGPNVFGNVYLCLIVSLHGSRLNEMSELRDQSLKNAVLIARSCRQLRVVFRARFITAQMSDVVIIHLIELLCRAVRSVRHEILTMACTPLTTEER